MRCHAVLKILLNPRLFLTAGLLAVVALFVTIYHDLHWDAARRLALRDGAPAIVNLEAFDAGRDAGPTGEVSLRAQLDMSVPMRVIYRRGVHPERAFIVPMLAVAGPKIVGTAGPEILGYFYLPAPLRAVEVLNVTGQMPRFTSVGDHGPIVEINGEPGAPDVLTKRAVEALEGLGRTTVDAPFVMTPYPEGRAVALTQKRVSSVRYVLMFWAIVLLGVGGFLTHRRDGMRRRAPEINRRNPHAGRFPVEPLTEKGRRRLAPLAPSSE